MNFLFEGQLEKKTRERSTESVMVNLSPIPALELQQDPNKTWKEHSHSIKHYDSLLALKTRYYIFFFQ